MANCCRWLAAIAAIMALAASASPLSVADCFEGSDFIAHAAAARENGMTREAFLNRMDEDLQLIQAFPPALRWFAHDEVDALPDPVRAPVFDRRMRPKASGALLAACFAIPV
jgi:hypothetical protein